MHVDSSIVDASRRILAGLKTLLREHYGDAYYGNVVGEGVSGDVTRRIDLLAEEYVVEEFSRAGFNTWVISEEKGVYKLRERAEYIVLLDPLDGSLNYASQIPFSSVSIAVYKASDPPPLLHEAIYGVVASIFSDIQVEYVNGKVLYNGRVFEQRAGKNTGFKVASIYFDSVEELSILRDMFMNHTGGFKLRVMGSAALEATLAALGLIDYFISLTGRLRNTDVALAVATAERLGGRVLVDPPLSNLRVDGVKILRRLAIGSSRDAFMEELRNRWFSGG
ncbi:inositol monophosphatase family protein [Desulfurococcus mucosus]|uniref:Inositol monophosphatase n=1 Tax=Desulfurococcus mucosus (strain ATCC 35584 / DSM 2162 / JCM 9187 / O7/1) TaxID=765177 RepID=E8R9N8_DESM0|nr:inositol monophosphatase family protein [Desulfurococcus mucosus]ADV65214.1 inositol monophosphatase [Desulfurococcus mucosus DSM 2162]